MKEKTRWRDSIGVTVAKYTNLLGKTIHTTTIDDPARSYTMGGGAGGFSQLTEEELIKWQQFINAYIGMANISNPETLFHNLGPARQLPAEFPDPEDESIPQEDF